VHTVCKYTVWWGHQTSLALAYLLGCKFVCPQQANEMLGFEEKFEKERIHTLFTFFHFT
jgi:hypothetical protein